MVFTCLFKWHSLSPVCAVLTSFRSSYCKFASVSFVKIWKSRGTHEHRLHHKRSFSGNSLQPDPLRFRLLSRCATVPLARSHTLGKHLRRDILRPLPGRRRRFDFLLESDSTFLSQHKMVAGCHPFPKTKRPKIGSTSKKTILR